MPSVTRSLLCALGAILASVLTACGSGSGSVGPANVRLVNTTGAAVTLTLNGGGSLSVNPSANPVSAYESVTPGTYTTSVTGASSALTAGPSQIVGLGTGQNYTVIAYQRDGVVSSATITDNLAAPTTGYATFNVANVSPDAGALDVYLLAHGTLPTSIGQANFTSVQGLSIAASFPAGTYDVVVTGAGNINDLRLIMPSVAFSSAQVGTLAFTGTTGGALVNGAVINQGGSATLVANTQARVRIWSAVANATVTATTAAAQALSTSTSPIPGNYTLVAAGDSIASISVTPSGGSATAVTTPYSYQAGGAAVASGPFAAGGDYTVVVFAASPYSAAVLTDSNQTVPNYASVRFINTVIAGNASLVVDSKSVQNSVALGTASAYSGVAPDSAAQFQVYGTGYATTGTAWTKPLVTGSVYSVLVYNALLPGIVIQDR